MKKFYRAFFRSINDRSQNLTVDLLLDDRRRWCERVPTGGWWGRLNSNDIWPFILKSDGDLDFGADDEETAEDDYDSSYRHGSLDLGNDQIIAVNEQYSLYYRGALTYLILEKLTDVTEL